MNFCDDKKVAMTPISTINKTEYTLLQCLVQCLKQSDNLSAHSVRNAKMELKEEKQNESLLKIHKVHKGISFADFLCLFVREIKICRINVIKKEEIYG